MRGHQRRTDRGRRCGGHPLRGPEGRPGHARDAHAHLGHLRDGPVHVRGAHHRRALLGRDEGAGRGAREPEAAAGGPIALIEEGDLITVDIEGGALTLQVDDDELARRRAAWQPPAQKHDHGVLAKYAKLVSSADEGAYVS